jgi:hypothetical protein
MWGAQGPRSLGAAAVHRGAPTPVSAQQAQQDDLFSSRLTGAQAGMRFGNQGSVAQAHGQVPVPDDFPPLNRATNGDVGGQERGVMSNIGFGAQNVAPGSGVQNRANNGLLNALSATSRAGDTRPQAAIARPQDARSPTGNDEAPQKDGMDTISGKNPHGAIGNDTPSGKGKEDEKPTRPPAQDPLEGMAPADKWGIKGLRLLMNNFPDYNALACGIDPTTLNMDLRSSE